MWDESRFQDQVERVRSTTWEITIIETNPVVVRVYNEELDRRHKIIPESIHCSCTVHKDVGPFCDHIVALLDAEGYAGALMREYIKERKNDLSRQRSASEDENPMLKKEGDEIMSLLKAVDIDDFSLARTCVDAASLLNASNDEEGEIEKAPTPDNREAFEEMVKQVRIGEGEDLGLPSGE